MQPVIGITTYQESSHSGLPIVMIYQAYVQAIFQAGGVPTMIPSLLATGGWDELYQRWLINPTIYFSVAWTLSATPLN